MALSAANIISTNTGSFESTTGTVTMPVAPAAGSGIIIAAGIGGDAVNIRSLDVPTGFQLVIGYTTGTRYGTPFVFYKASATGSESSWTLNVTGGATQQVLWAVFEVTGLDPVPTTTPDDNFSSSVVGSPRTSNVEGDSSIIQQSYDTMAMDVVFTANTTPTQPSVTPAYAPVLANVQRANATVAHTLAVGATFSTKMQAYSGSASINPSSYIYGTIVVFPAATARFGANIDAMFGAEIGTSTGITNTSTATNGGPGPWDAVVGTPSIVATNPRTGTYCLELSSSAAAECLTWIDPNSATQRGNLSLYAPIPTQVVVERFSMYLPSPLPGADVEIASVEAGSLANGVVIWYRSASQKLGVKIGAGTEQLSDTTVSANQWIGVDYRYDPRTTTHTCDWQIDYDATPGNTTGSVAQTQATATGMTASVIRTVRKGWTVARTATVRYDDIALSKVRQNYPLGDIRIYPLGPDPAGTPTAASTSDFNTFTNNGTMAAWNATTVRNTLRQRPPVVGATASGVAQVSTATNLVTVPMETYVAGPSEALRALRWYFAGWAASASSATLYGSADDQDASPFPIGPSFSVLAHGFDNAKMTWLTRMTRKLEGHATHSEFYYLTQAKLDAMIAKFGNSTDANPDIGLLSIIAELAVQAVPVTPLFGSMASATIDPNSSGVVAVVADAPVMGTGNSTLQYEVDGFPTTVPITEGSSTTQQLNAPDEPTVNWIAMFPPPEPNPVD